MDKELKNSIIYGIVNHSESNAKRHLLTCMDNGLIDVQDLYVAVEEGDRCDQRDLVVITRIDSMIE